MYCESGRPARVITNRISPAPAYLSRALNGAPSQRVPGDVAVGRVGLGPLRHRFLDACD